jgi:hypothetical protein
MSASITPKEPQCLSETAPCDGHLFYSFMLSFDTHLVNTLGSSKLKKKINVD